MHWYPEAQGGGQRIVFGNMRNKEIEAARIQAPRSLWDASYYEDSWISKNVGAIELIPRLKRPIDAAYPGTKLVSGTTAGPKTFPARLRLPKSAEFLAAWASRSQPNGP